MPKVIVAEDDKLISASLIQAFKDAGFEAVPAYDGEEAVARAKEIKPDAMVLDIMMPKLDGIGVLWELKANSELSQISVLVLTNLGDPETLSKIMGAGGTDYLLKSEQSMDQVVKKIQEILAR